MTFTLWRMLRWCLACRRIVCLLKELQELASPRRLRSMLCSSQWKKNKIHSQWDKTLRHIVSQTSLLLYLLLFSFRALDSTHVLQGSSLFLFWFLFWDSGSSPIFSACQSWSQPDIFVYCDNFCCDDWLLSDEKIVLGSVNPHVYIFLYELKVFLWINSWIGNFQENSF